MVGTASCHMVHSGKRSLVMIVSYKSKMLQESKSWTMCVSQADSSEGIKEHVHGSWARPRGHRLLPNGSLELLWIGTLHSTTKNMAKNCGQGNDKLWRNGCSSLFLAIRSCAQLSMYIPSWGGLDWQRIACLLGNGIWNGRGQQCLAFSLSGTMG